MTIPVYVAVAQWVLLLTLGILVVLMFRQLGRQLAASQPAAAPGPEPGSRAAAIGYTRPDGGEEVFRPGGGRAALVAFAEPTCPACEELVAALNTAHAEGGLARVRPLLVTSEPLSYLQISAPFRATRLPLGRITADAARQAYGVSATPLLVAIDGAGVVRAAGPAARHADVRAFVQACLLPPAATGTLPAAAAGAGPAGPGVLTAAAGEEGGGSR
ncbi:MAG: hypothetical protein ACM32E_29420 [Gemmatimonadota bacterium]